MKIIYNKESDTFGLICNRAEMSVIAAGFGTRDVKEAAISMYPNASSEMILNMPTGMHYFSCINHAYCSNSDYEVDTFEEGF